MRRGPGILVAGGILIVASIILVVLSISSLASLTESMPTNLSTKNVITATLNANQTAIKASLRNIGVTLGFAFVEILVATILGVDGIIALIGGTVIFFVDRRRDKHHPQTQHQGAPVA